MRVDWTHLKLIKIGIELLKAFKKSDELCGSFRIRHRPPGLYHALFIEQGLEAQRELILLLEIEDVDFFDFPFLYTHGVNHLAID